MRNAKALLDLFFFFDSFELVSFKTLKTGYINQTLLVEIKIENQYRKYILQKINQSVFPNPTIIVENMAMVAQHLKDKNYPYHILEAIKTIDGNFLAFDKENNPWRLTKFLHNTVCYSKVESTEIAYASARMFGTFYKYLIDIDVKKLKTPLVGFINFESRMLAFEKAIEETPSEKKAFSKNELDYLVANKSLPEKFIESQKTNQFPIRAIHADPKISNILFKKNTNTAKCIIDLDTLMPGTILYDYGDMVRSYTNNRAEDDPLNENVFNIENYNALTQGFLSSIGNLLLPIEINNLAYSTQVVTYIQAIRFYSDYLNGNIYYQAKHPMQNLHRAQNQINLLKQLIKIKQNF
jgi:DNA-dependent RNA polymerase auxiliary subunit epsilon